MGHGQSKIGAADTHTRLEFVDSVRREFYHESVLVVGDGFDSNKSSKKGGMLSAGVRKALDEVEYECFAIVVGGHGEVCSTGGGFVHVPTQCKGLGAMTTCVVHVAELVEHVLTSLGSVIDEHKPIYIFLDICCKWMGGIGLVGYRGWSDLNLGEGRKEG
jgi:hypothetical protein